MIEEQFQALYSSPHPDQIPYITKHIVEGEVGRFHDQTAGFDLGKVKDVVDNTKQVFRRCAHLCSVIALPAIEISLLQQPRHPDNHIHRRADLMAHVGQEFIL
nr:hypothetical protein [Synechococcus sp. CBW1006]